VTRLSAKEIAGEGGSSDDERKRHAEEEDGDERRRGDHPIMRPAERPPRYAEQGFDDDHEHCRLDADECRLDER
jgi:hypothetical protein